MTVQEVSCLFCRTELEIAAKTKNKRTGRVLGLILKRLWTALNVDFPKELREWNFSCEPFPFCLSCQKVILRLCRLMDQLKTLELEMSRCVSTLSMLAIISKSNSDQLRLVNESPKRSPNGRVWDRERLEKKCSYLRNVIIKRFDVQVSLERCSVNNFISSRVDEEASPKADERSDILCEKLPELMTIADDSSSSDPVDFDVNESPSSSMTKSESSPGIEIITQCRSPPAVDDFDQLPSEFGEASNPTADKDPPECSDALVRSAPGPESLSPTRDEDISKLISISDSKPQETTESPTLLADVEKEASDQNPAVDTKVGAVGDHLASTKLHLGFEAKVSRYKGVCLTCGFKCESKTRGDKSIWCQLKSHINRFHARLDSDIHLVHAETQTYELFGFQFQEADKGYKCSTCKRLFPFSSRKNSKIRWINIRGHILNHHATQEIRETQRRETAHSRLKQKLAAFREKHKTNPTRRGRKNKPGGENPVTENLGVIETLENSETRSHAGFSASVTEEKAVCLKCGTQFQSTLSWTAWNQVKQHIQNQHLSKQGVGSKVEVVDQDQKRYRVNGFEFQELENGCECSTCKKMVTFGAPDGGRPQKWKNIQGHILRTHAVPKQVVYSKVKVVDEDKKVYHVNGFEFRELENGYECSTCKKICTFRSKRKKWINVKMHIQRVHSQFLYGKCEICNKEVSDLYAHMRSAHGTESRRQVCEICGKEFKSRIHLSKHKKYHREPRFSCGVCGKKFPVLNALKIHQRIHDGEKPYICEHCGKTFRFSHVLKTHVASAHGERKFACDQCDWKFGVKFLLTRHVKQVHEGIKPPPPKKRKKAEGPSDDSEGEM